MNEKNGDIKKVRQSCKTRIVNGPGFPSTIKKKWTYHCLHFPRKTRFRPGTNAEFMPCPFALRSCVGLPEERSERHFWPSLAADSWLSWVVDACPSSDVRVRPLDVRSAWGQPWMAGLRDHFVGAPFGGYYTSRPARQPWQIRRC